MKRTKKFFSEFKTFVTRGNVLDMAVGIIIGGAFTAIVTALTDHILRPLINWIISLCIGDSNIAAYTFLKTVYDASNNVDMAASIYIDWGSLISAIINFILIAFVLFLIIKAINQASEANKKAKENYLTEREKKKAIRAYKKSGMSKEEAEAQYEADLKAAEEEAARAAAEAAANAEPPKPTTDELLVQIRDLLAANKTQE